MKNIYVINCLLIFLLLSSSCKDSSTEPQGDKKSGFNTPEEYLKNPSVGSAISNAGIEIHNGETPPPLAGTYKLNGTIKKTSYLLSEWKNKKIYSSVVLYNQTQSGKINYQEKVNGYTAIASGGYITGENGKFTIWQESVQTGSSAGLPDDITITVVLLISGTKYGNGNLFAKGISIVTDAKTTNNNYNIDQVEGVWWMWESDFLLIGAQNTDIKTSEDNLFRMRVFSLPKELTENIF